MDSPRFLSVENVLALHASTTSVEGGASGIRDPALLESAVMLPQQQFGGSYLHADLPAMAAAYLYHLCSNHPFVDGNKRVGAIAAFVFLDVNGRGMSATEDELETKVMQLADGQISKSELTHWMKSVASQAG